MKTWQKLRQNPALFGRYLVRECVISACRLFLTEHGFHEVEVPLLAPSLPAESYIEVFETKLLDRQRQEKKAYLTTSPEAFLKKLLVAGIGNCFSLTKSFRNTESQSNLHNPEFTILEWYQVDADYKDLMKTTEELVLFIVRQLFSSSEGAKRLNREVTLGKKGSRPSSNDKYKILYQGQTVDLTPPWEQLSMSEAFARYAKVDLGLNLDLSSMQQTAQKKGYSFVANTTWEELFNQIYLNEVEPKIGQTRPTFIYDFPSQLAALAKKKDKDPRFAERVELYMGGLELGDGYSELTDAQEQEARFISETKERQRLGKTDYPYDQDFIEAIKTGLPKCAGLALGIDRVVMLLADVARIQDVLFFPADEMWNIS